MMNEMKTEELLDVNGGENALVRVLIEGAKVVGKEIVKSEAVNVVKEVIKDMCKDNIKPTESRQPGFNRP